MGTNDLQRQEVLVIVSLFIGGPRHMFQKYQDALSGVRVLRKPDLFITFTCNGQWPEKVREILAHQAPNDRPDIIARVSF
jgi:hypothetical protein